MAGKLSCPMDETEQTVIENNELIILALMDPDKISMLLRSKGVIDEYDHKEIMLPSGKVEKNKVLISRLLTRGSGAFKAYIAALRESATEDHSQLARILLKNVSESVPHRADEMLQQSRDRRVREKLENHEVRLRALERSDTEITRLHTDLAQKNKELEKLREELEAQRGENQALTKRITDLETQVQSLEAQIKAQEILNKQLSEQHLQSAERIEQLEGKNCRIEEKLEAHEKQMDEMKGIVKSMVASSNGTASPKGLKQATRPAITPMNRFDSQERIAGARAAAIARRRAAEKKAAKE